MRRMFLIATAILVVSCGARQEPAASESATPAPRRNDAPEAEARLAEQDENPGHVRDQLGAGTVEIVNVEEWGGDGDFPPHLVARMAGLRRLDVVTCYEHELHVSPQVGGIIRVRMTVKEDGEVDATAVVNTTRSDSLEACALRVVREFRFNPGSEGGLTVFEYGYAFSPTR